MNSYFLSYNNIINFKLLINLFVNFLVFNEIHQNPIFRSLF